jgi:hypothetical protein
MWFGDKYIPLCSGLHSTHLHGNILDQFEKNSSAKVVKGKKNPFS